MAEDRKTQPRFSQFALAAARDTSAFDTKTVPPEVVGTAAADDVPADPSIKVDEAPIANGHAQPSTAAHEAKPRQGAAPRSPKVHDAATTPQPQADEELVSFTVRLPASLYMRMRRSLGLREKLGELCVAAITRELDGRG